MTFLDIIIVIVKSLVLALAATTLFAYFTLFERIVLARLQNRVGPNRAGYIPLPGGRKLLGGFMQPAADAVKLFFKEEVLPALADKWVYIVSPAFAMIPALVIWATIPVGCWPVGEGAQLGCLSGTVNFLQLAEIDVGILYLLAVTSVGVYGIAIAGWASNNKYSMLGGIRASAQVLSYELALGLAILGVVMQAETFSTNVIVERQAGWWFIVPQFLGFVIFLVASTAEVVRSPFDLVEAEQELVGGYNTEFSSMKFAVFFMSEYIKLIAMNAIAVTLFLGGWRFPGHPHAGRVGLAQHRRVLGQRGVRADLARGVPAEGHSAVVPIGVGARPVFPRQRARARGFTLPPADGSGLEGAGLPDGAVQYCADGGAEMC